MSAIPNSAVARRWVACVALVNPASWRSATAPAATGIARNVRRRLHVGRARQADLLPVEYYHVVFTLLAPVADPAYTNKAGDLLAGCSR